MTFGLVGNITKQPLASILSTILGFLRNNSVPFILHRDLWTWYRSQPGHPEVPASAAVEEQDLPLRCDMIIALGGDGTMLSTARILDGRPTPLLGVNLGKLGFLAEVSVEEIETCLRAVLNNDYYIEERMLLACTSTAEPSVLYAMNEIVIDKGASARVIELETKVNDEFLVTYSADGMIINTPTGSTAYSLATGGPIVIPQSDVMTIVPVAPHTLTARPVIVPDSSRIRISVESGAKLIHVTADGQIERLYATPVEFSIRKAERNVRLVKRHGRSYFDLLRTKLLWGRDVRREQSV